MNKHIFDVSNQRWSLRKVKIGLVSILLGFTFMTTSQLVKADDVSSSQNVEEVNITQRNTNQAQNEEPTSHSIQPKLSDVQDLKSETTKNEKFTSETKDQFSNQDNFNINQVNTNKIRLDKTQNNKSISFNDEKITKQGTNQVLDKVDAQKNDDLHKLNTEQMNSKYLKKYENLIHDAEKANKWNIGFPSESDQRTIENGETKIMVNKNSDGPNPMLNNSIIYGNYKKEKFIYDDGKSSFLGIDVQDAYHHFIPLSTTIKETNYDWVKSDGNIIIRRFSQFDSPALAGISYEVKKNNGETNIISKSKDNDIYDFSAQLNIFEYLIITPEGNIIHKINFEDNSNYDKNDQDSDAPTAYPLFYYVLIDTGTTNQKDLPIYSSGKDGLYVFDDSQYVVYGIKPLDKTKVTAIDFSLANSNGDSPSGSVGVDYLDEPDEKVQKNVNDNAILISSPDPEIYLKNQKSTDIWYIETAFGTAGNKPEDLSHLVNPTVDTTQKDDEINHKIDDINKQIEDLDNAKSNFNNETDSLDPIFGHFDNDSRIKDIKEGTEKSFKLTDNKSVDIMESIVKPALTKVIGSTLAGTVINGFSHFATFLDIEPMLKAVNEGITGVVKLKYSLQYKVPRNILQRMKKDLIILKRRLRYSTSLKEANYWMNSTILAMNKKYGKRLNKYSLSASAVKDKINDIVTESISKFITAFSKFMFDKITDGSDKAAIMLFTTVLSVAKGSFSNLDDEISDGLDKFNSTILSTLGKPLIDPISNSIWNLYFKK